MIDEKELTAHMKMPAATFYLGLIRNVSVDLAKRVGFSDEDLSKIEMAVDEALTNVIEHAYRGRKSFQFNSKANKDQFCSPVELYVKADDEKILIVLRDKGKGFDFDSYGNIDLHEHVSRMNVGGIGVCIMRAFMDKVEYTHKNNSCNELRMMKYLRHQK